uniref:Tyrosine phosphatase n=1 Tax=Caenorhabditis japonica TaxID=281687 RepID=A0A8R1DGA2_CAEJA
MSGGKKGAKDKKKQEKVSKSNSKGSAEQHEPSGDAVKTPATQQQDQTFENARAGIVGTVGWMTQTETKSTGLSGYLKRTPFDRPSEAQSQAQKTYAFTANPDRNRNPNFPLYDKTRVRLKIEQETDNNYINASYVSCPPCDRKWIVAQHPMEQFYEDFWKMVFYEEVDVIVALFSPDEGLPMYFPTVKGAYFNHGTFFVHCWKMAQPTGKNQATSYTIEVLPQGCSNSRFTTILHYPYWPKGQVPCSPKVILKAIQALDPGNKVKAKSKCLIHSSDGINRPACFVMIDYMVELMFRNNVVDIPELITQIRTQRGGAFDNRIYLLYALYVVIDYVKIRLTKYQSAPEVLKEIQRLQKTMRRDFAGITAKEQGTGVSGKVPKSDVTVE